MSNSPEKRLQPSIALSKRPPPVPRDALRDTSITDRGLPRPGDIVAGKYKIERLLGRGGMGAVFEAFHVLSGKRVALKWMLPAAHDAGLAERFLHEARATARIDHPNVVDIYDVGKQGDSVYLVMELLHGESLAARLERAPMAPSEVVPVLMPALRGVAAAHAHGVIHRDLKPDNIFLCTGPDGDTRDCKVLDFGISKITEEHDFSMTKRGMVMGTPYYMSPEQLRGLTEVDERGDVYAFGVILYEMLADCYPFDDDSYDALVVKIATSDPTPLHILKPDLDPLLTSVVTKALSRDRAHRYQSVEELAWALEPFAQGVSFQLSLMPPPHARRFSSTQPVETIRTVRGSTGTFASAPTRAMLLLALALVIGSGTLLVAHPAPRILGASAPTSVTLNTGERIDVSPTRAASPQPVASSLEALPRGSSAPSGQLAGERVVAADRLAAPNRAQRRRPRQVAKRPAGPPLVASAASTPAPASPTQLPSDWDERLTIPPASAQARATTASPGAGTLTASDL